MSDSEKLRRKQGNIWLALSFLFFTLSICFIWIISLNSWGTFFIVGNFMSFIFGYICYDLAHTAYETYVGVNNEEINKSDSAKLKKIIGICQLVGAFVFFALAINDIWVIFVFSEIISSFLPVFTIFLGLFVALFFGNVKVVINNFIAIDRCIKGKFVKPKHNGGLLTVHSSPKFIIPPPSKKNK